MDERLQLLGSVEVNRLNLYFHSYLRFLLKVKLMPLDGHLDTLA